ncbi:MAG: TetR/AcrR family transcriptional regulator [Oscillospiraceae bacterium]
MKPSVTSKEEILRICRKLVSEDGLSSLNMRTVAQRCNVALGSLYNYFPSKNDLVIATIESVWMDIFQPPCETRLTFLDDVQQIFERVKERQTAYPNFLTAHSIGFASHDKGQARQMMAQYFRSMENEMLAVLKQDQAVRQNAFNGTFTPSGFVEFVLSGLLSLLVQRKDSCAVLLEMIRRTLY